MVGDYRDYAKALIGIFLFFFCAFFGMHCLMYENQVGLGYGQDVAGFCAFFLEKNRFFFDSIDRW
jgi:hypothetical protein